MLQEIVEDTDINQDWLNLKQVIIEVATEFRLCKDVKNANHWWDDECKRAIQESNEGRGKYLIRKTRKKLGYLSTKKEQ
jgi:hypothetical protein